jgi:hypothetical protein
LGDKASGVVPFSRPLTQFLRQAHNLEQLYISDPDTIIEHQPLWPEVATAIIQCPRLANLRLYWDGDFSRQVLQEIGGLRVLCIDNHGDPSITSIIQCSNSTLEALYVMTPIHSRRITLRLDRTDCWPHLCFLYMREPHGIPTGTLTSAFPNLRVLRFSLIHSGRSPGLRILNERGSPSWPTLDHVRGTVPAVYNLALSSHVRELELSYVGGTGRTIQEEILDIVQHTQPLALTLRVPFGGNRRLSESFCHRLAEYASRLQYLETNGFTFDEHVRLFLLL